MKIVISAILLFKNEKKYLEKLDYVTLVHYYKKKAHKKLIKIKYKYKVSKFNEK